mmetsp:Transcript_5897/g.7730  ORF Transcript_5897/g.7730 Transcript_5897/m.7730 type:complete len:93 (-) Transcript_5897:47-325(-)
MSIDSDSLLDFYLPETIDLRTYSKDERSEDLSAYAPFSTAKVEYGYVKDETKPQTITVFLQDFVFSIRSIFDHVLETEMRSKVSFSYEPRNQ